MVAMDLVMKEKPFQSVGATVLPDKSAGITIIGCDGLLRRKLLLDTVLRLRESFGDHKHHVDPRPPKKHGPSWW